MQNRTRLIRPLKIFAVLWALLITFSFLWGAALTWQEDGFAGMGERYTLLSLSNVMTYAFSYAPAIIAYILSDAFRRWQNY